MGMPSPFELGRATANSIGSGFDAIASQSNMDAILSNALATEDEEVMDKALIGLVQHVRPEHQSAALNVLSQHKNLLKEKKLINEQIKIADQIEKENPNSSLHRTIANVYRSGLPTEEKERLIKTLSATSPYKAEQQQRLQLDSVLKRYNSRIKEVDESLKSKPFDKDLKEQKKALQDERDMLLNFQALQPKETIKEKIKFDINNPKHKERRDQVLKEAGSKEKAQVILEEEFEL